MLKICSKYLLTSTIGPGHAETCLKPYANNKSADQPAYPRSLISTFIVRYLDSMICILAISKVSRFQLASVAEQAGLNVTWSKIPKDTFSPDVAHNNTSKECIHRRIMLDKENKLKGM